MTKMRDEKGRYIKSSDDGGWSVVKVVIVAALACAYGLMFGVVMRHEPVQAPPPVTVLEPSEPIDWNKVTVHSVPVEAWQEEHDKAMLKAMEIRLQRVIDRNEARETPAFPAHH